MSRPELRHINSGAAAIKSCRKSGLVGVDSIRMNRGCRVRSEMVATQGEKSGDGDETRWEEAKRADDGGPKVCYLCGQENNKKWSDRCVCGPSGQIVARRPKRAHEGQSTEANMYTQSRDIILMYR